jgi:polyribonucleotide nucleotidyltransferase
MMLLVHALAADIPLKKAVAGVRVGWLPETGLVINPTSTQMAGSRLDLMMAGTRDAVLMIEGFCDFLTEGEMLKVGGLGGAATWEGGWQKQGQEQGARPMG